MKPLPPFPFPSIIAAAFLGSFLVGGCASSKVEKDFYDTSKPKYAIAVDKDGRKEGVETWWYPNGTKKYEAFNRGGVREGMFTAWYDDGTMWYQGFEYHGKPESTLTYWRPNGNLKSLAKFREGIQLERHDYDELGKLIDPDRPPSAPGTAAPAAGEADADGLARLRKTSLQMWALRVRQTVEGFWVLPKQFEKERPYRAVAKIKVGRDGRILGVSWIEKSPSAAFNTLAQQTFKRIKRLPAFPPQVRDQTLDVQYEFISLGKPVPRRKLEARDAPEASEP